jgi:PAS domain S-box-containing protein
MNQKLKAQILTRRYALTLGKYLVEEREKRLEEAYDLGRSAIAGGLGVLDMARIHLEACEKCLRGKNTIKARREIAKREGNFFLQSLSPFEATHRGFRVTSAELQKRNRELLVQISERRRAKKALQTSQARLEAILENSPMVVFLKDKNGRYLQVNRQFERQFGVPRDRIAGRTDQELFPRAQAAQFREHDRMVLRDGVPLEFEETATYRDGVHVSIVSKFPLRDDRGKIYGMCGIATDITARKRALEALRLSEERFRLLVSNVRNYAIFLLDPKGRVASWNTGAERVWGWGEPEIIGRHFSCFFTPEEIREDKPGRELQVANKEGRFEVEGWRLRKNGTRFWASVVLTAIRDASGRPRWFAKVVRDMTERKQLEESLRNLSSKILHAQEEERRRISRELHDEVGQSLTAISVTLAALRNNGTAKKAQTLRRVVAGTQRLLAGTMEAVHRFARELRPAALDELGLLPALRSHVRSFASRTGLQVSFSATPAAERISNEQKTTLFRIAQESLTNVAKHARASRVSISLQPLGGELCMEIADNGRSFRESQRESPQSNTRLGLLGMQERARLVNGRFSIKPKPGRGTTVRVTIPFASAPSPAIN